MKKFLILFTICAIVLTQHPLQSFQQDFRELSSHYNQGDTSSAFSIAMRIYLSVQTLYKELQIQKPIQLFDIPSSCEEKLQTIKLLSDNANWVESFQQIFAHLESLAYTCTNRDFKMKNVQDSDPTGCAACVVLLRIVQNYASVHKRDITDFIQRQFCDLFEGVIRPTCEAFVHFAGPTIIESLIKKQTPDRTCLKLKICTNPKCKISSQWASEFEENNPLASEEKKPAPWDWLINLFVSKFGQHHLSPFDLDNDTFSDISTFRGYNWKGADCNELNKNVYPGRKEGSNLMDHDCNGIFGTDVKKQKSYENLFCSNSKRFGVAVIGDSAGAHFSIPQKYFNASMIGKGTFHDILQRAANQFDIPHESGYTGNTNTNGYVRHSVYKYVRDWNLCNNNDYQNIAVNGAYSQITNGYLKMLKRDQNKDYPLLMFLELIGNDVCAKSFNRMTTTTKFKDNILRILHSLDKVVPEGSHLIMLGLADGELLYEHLHDWTHPLNVTYEQVYDFLNCLDLSPCWGWLNSNATVRKFTNDRAANLTKVYKEIVDSGIKFKNFDYKFYEFPTHQIIDRRVMQGGDARQLIERCDGFHPNGLFHSYLGDWLWNKIKTDVPEWIGDQNPHNDEIRKIFNIKDIK